MKVSYLGMTSYEGPAPGLETWPAPPRFCVPDVARYSMDRSLDLCELAESLGFDWVSLSEHHYAPYQMTPNPVVMAAALTQRVKRARIALLGPLVPLCNPVRLAEELAMLDTLSHGRLTVLFLRGTPNEHGTYDTPPEATRAMTQEGIDLVRKAWTEDAPFAWTGEHYDFSTVSVWPRVQQLPHPPIYGSGNSEESIVYAASRHMGIAFSFAPPDVVRGWVDLYRRECARAGWEPTPDHVIYRGLAYLSQNDAQAEADAGAFFGARLAEQSKLASTTLGGPPVVPLILTPYFLGGPETFVERFAVLRDCGVGVVDMAWVIGSHDQQVASLELFAAQVMPTVQSWDQSRFPGAAEIAVAAQPAITA